MKLDAKFQGTITKVKDGTTVPEDQWAVFLAKDNAFFDTMPYYIMRCIKRGADSEQVVAAMRMYERMKTWREKNPSLCKTPDAAGERLLDAAK